jgi:hypothetical protein
MVFGTLVRVATAVSVCALLAGCGVVGDSGLTTADLAFSHAGRATTPAAPADDPRLFPDDSSDTAPARVVGAGLQCVPYARAHSSVDIHGDAYTWWEKAAGVYARSSDPADGAVMVLKNYAGRHRAHVAVVRRIISPREIRIDHANWLNDGAIYVNDPVLDVSADNNWSQIKVWNISSGSWGTRVYAVQGFIGPAPATANPLVASNRGLGSDPIGRLIAASTATAAYPSAPRFNHSRMDH